MSRVLTLKNKKCWDCGKRKPLSLFYKHCKAKDGHSSQCGECNRKYRKSYWKKNRAKMLVQMKNYRTSNPRTIKNGKLKYAYGVDIETFEAMLEAQAYKCLIDGQYIDSKTACVDHNHRTGMVRGLLCHSCNKGLGFFEDNVAVLKRAINYLRKT